MLYQTLISFGIYFDCDCVIFYKIISIVFDYALAVSVACLVTREQKKKFLSMKFQVVYAIVLLLPTVILNSAYWGQCDSIYTTFLVLLLMFLYDDHYCLAFIMLGIGLSFKLQTLLIVPFIICYYLCIKSFLYDLNIGISRKWVK